MMRVTVASLLFLSVIPAAQADTVGDVFDKYKDSKSFRYSVAQVGDALGWANSLLVNRKQTPIFCPPDNLSISDDQYWTIIEVYLDRHPEDRKLPENAWNMVAVTSLMYTFPCK